MSEPGWHPRRPRTDSDEHPALRRIARLVADGAPRSTLFPAVLAEVGEHLHAEEAVIARYEAGCAVAIDSWSRTGARHIADVRARLEGRTVPTLVFETHRPALITRDASDESPLTVPTASGGGLQTATVGAPVRVEGLLWGLLAATPRPGVQLLPGTEQRLAVFADLVATGIGSTSAREELRRIADEQAAMRRLALLVARGVEPALLFAAVAEEVGALFDADATAVLRYEPDGEATLVGSSGWATPPSPGAAARTGHPVRWDDDGPPTAGAPEGLRQEGLRSAVVAPIVVDGRLWGGITVGTRRRRFPADTDQRLAEFNELVATAIASAEAQSNLIRSRARIVASADEARRRLERDLHDGAQQRLVALTVQLRAARLRVPAAEGGLGDELDGIALGLTEVLDELRTLARGIRPPILAEGGLRHAVMALARRSTIPVHLELTADERLPQPLEASAYYIVAEAMTDATKHAGASTMTVTMESSGGVLSIQVQDDGIGGADVVAGTAVVGIKDRVEALGGRMTIDSAPAAGTNLRVELPLGNPSR